jgi:hypothetical protein
MKRFLALVLTLALVTLGLPTVSFAAGPQTSGQVAGTAQTGNGSPIANGTVRLRNTGTGEVAGTSRTAVNGAYSFGNVPAGNYVVELVDANGAVIATSMPVTLAAGSMAVTGVALTTAVGKAGVGAVGASGAGAFFHSTGGILLLAAAGGGAVAGIYAATRTTSASQ